MRSKFCPERITHSSPHGQTLLARRILFARCRCATGYTHLGLPLNIIASLHAWFRLIFCHTYQPEVPNRLSVRHAVIVLRLLRIQLHGGRITLT